MALIVFPLAAEAGILDRALSYFTDTAVAAQRSGSSISGNVQTMPLLRAALNLDPNPAKGGGDITIIDDTALLAEVGPSGTILDAEVHAQENGAISIYVVREGDTLSTIAKLFKVSVNTIVWANDLKRGSLISPGQTLVILPISGVRYTVKKGDTLASIAKKYKGDSSEILRYNDLPEDVTLIAGMEIIIPDGEVPAPVVSTTRLVAGSGGPVYEGYYLRPLVGGRKTQGLHGYNGVDIAAPIGTPVLASAAGNVIISRNFGWNGGYGNYVVIAHTNGTQTLYAHLNTAIVSPGTTVVQGQVIGYVGNTGKSTGAHLHFEVRGARNPF